MVGDHFLLWNVGPHGITFMTVFFLLIYISPSFLTGILAVFCNTNKNGSAVMFSADK